MNKQRYGLWEQFQERWLSRRSLIRGAASTVLGAGFLRPKVIHTEDDREKRSEPQGLAPIRFRAASRHLLPTGFFIHHNPLRASLASIGDPSQITESDGRWA